MWTEQTDESNSYVLDAESAVEMTRLMRQDQVVTAGMGGLFPEKPDLSNVGRILDLACGPGNWALEVAFRYSDIEVVGVDISTRMITYANAQAGVQKRKNVRFQVANILQPLPFPDQSFDLVNARFLVGLMRPDMWPDLLRQSVRLLRPGGVLRFTELEWGFSNKPSFEKVCSLINEAMRRAGYTFSPNGLHLGLLPVLPRLLRNAGISQVQTMAHAIEFSADLPVQRDGFYSNMLSIFAGIEPLVGKTLQMSREEWRNLTQQALAEMYEEDFCGMWLLITAWGYSPTEKEPEKKLGDGEEKING